MGHKTFYAGNSVLSALYTAELCSPEDSFMLSILLDWMWPSCISHKLIQEDKFFQTIWAEIVRTFFPWIFVFLWISSQYGTSIGAVQLGLSFSFESFGHWRTSCGLSPNYPPRSKAVKVLKHKVLKSKFLKGKVHHKHRSVEIVQNTQHAKSATLKGIRKLFENWSQQNANIVLLETEK